MRCLIRRASGELTNVMQTIAGENWLCVVVKYTQNDYFCRQPTGINVYPFKGAAKMKRDDADRQAAEADMDRSKDNPITIERNPNRVRVLFNGRVVADTTGALTLKEVGLPAVHYIPRE